MLTEFVLVVALETSGEIVGVHFVEHAFLVEDGATLADRALEALAAKLTHRVSFYL